MIKLIEYFGEGLHRLFLLPNPLILITLQNMFKLILPQHLMPDPVMLIVIGCKFTFHTEYDPQGVVRPVSIRLK